MPNLTLPKRIIYFLATAIGFLPEIVATQDQFETPWTIRCELIQHSDKKRCIMYQEILLKKEGLPVLQFSIGLIEPGQEPIVLITLPLGIYLPTGVSLMIDSLEKVNFPIERCDQDGCYILVALTDERLETLKNGRELQVFFDDSEKSPIVISLSLLGFQEAFIQINSHH